MIQTPDFYFFLINFILLLLSTFHVYIMIKICTRSFRQLRTDAVAVNLFTFVMTPLSFAQKTCNKLLFSQ